MQRDNKWLRERLKQIWNRYFHDVPPANNIIIKFGRPARTRLGSIKFGRRKIDPNTIITLTGFFRDHEIPEFVIDATVAHELVHYAHGFHSPHPQLYRHPHHGGVVRRELIDRGLEDVLELSRKWLKNNWPDYVRRFY